MAKTTTAISPPPAHDPERQLYPPDTKSDDHDFDFSAECIEHLLPEPQDPVAYKARAEGHLRRRPKADLTDLEYRFPAIFWSFDTSHNPYFGGEPRFRDDNRIESLDTLACIIRFHTRILNGHNYKHTPELLTQSQARSFAQLDRLATDWCRYLDLGHHPTNKVAFDILHRDQSAGLLNHLSLRIEQGKINTDMPFVVDMRKKLAYDPDNDLLPPMTAQAAVQWIRDLRGHMLHRCHRHFEAAADRLDNSRGQKSITHADMVVCSLALRLNPPPQLPRTHGAAASRRRGTTDSGAAAACPEPVEESRRRHPERSAQPWGHEVEACPERSRRGSGESSPPTKKPCSPARHRTKRLRVIAKNDRTRPKRKP